MDKASDFDRIEVGPGTYDEHYVRSYEISPRVDYYYDVQGVLIDKYLTIAGSGVDSTIIRYVGVVGRGAEEIGSVTLRNLTIAEDETGGGSITFEIDGRRSSRGLPAIYVESIHQLRLENSSVRDSSPGIGIYVFGSGIRLISSTLSDAPLWLESGSSAAIEDSAFSQSNIVAITGSLTVTMNDSVMTGGGLSSSAEVVTLDEVVISGGGRGVEIRAGDASIANTLIDGTTSAGVVAFSGANIRLVDSTVENNDRVGVEIWDGATATIEDSLIIDNGGDGISNSGSLLVRRTQIRGNTQIGIFNHLRGTATIEASDFSGNGNSAILNGGELSLTESYVHHNLGTGSAITNSMGSMVIETSTIAYNEGGYGIYNGSPGGRAGGTLTMINSTVSDNGDGVWNQSGMMVLNHVTIAGNDDIGVSNLGSLRLQNTLIAPHSFQACISESIGTVTTAGENITSNGNCGGLSFPVPVAGVGDTFPEELIDLLPLDDYGGPTFTRALGPDSPALDAALGASPTVDQRGQPRPFGAASDIGAFEVNAGDGTTRSLEITLTPEGPPLARLTANARCRVGPGLNFGDYDFFEASDVTHVHARSPFSDWYQVDAPNLSGKCWTGQSVLDIDATAAVLQALPVLNPPTPTPEVTETPSASPPAAPSGLEAVTLCASPNYNVSLSWNDNASNEEGYRVYRNGQLIATLGANISNYTDTAPPGSGPQTYYVEAFNAKGAVKSNNIQDQGCIF